MPNKSNLNKLKHYRLKQNLTQQTVANYIGHKSANRLSTWEHGIAKPSLQNLLKLSELYRAPIEKLYPSHIKVKSHQFKQRSIASIPYPEDECRDMTDEQLVDTLAEFIVAVYIENTRKKT